MNQVYYPDDLFMVKSSQSMQIIGQLHVLDQFLLFK